MPGETYSWMRVAARWQTRSARFEQGDAHRIGIMIPQGKHPAGARNSATREQTFQLGERAQVTRWALMYPTCSDFRIEMHSSVALILVLLRSSLENSLIDLPLIGLRRAQLDYL